MYDSKNDKLQGKPEKEAKERSQTFRKSESGKIGSKTKEDRLQQTIPNKQLNRDTLLNYYNGII